MLLTDEEICRFQRAVDRDDPLIYADEYDVAELGRQQRNAGL